MQKKIKAYRKKYWHCERCLQDHSLLVHHKDRNRQNNNENNLEVLCTSCHAVEHRRFLNINWVREKYYETNKNQLVMDFEY